MANDVLLNKAATIERCIERVREEYNKGPDTFSEDYTRQDAAILNIQRACEACIDGATHLVRLHRLGSPQSYRDLFHKLEEAGLLPSPLAGTLKKMVGFRNIAVHNYEKIQLPIVKAIIEKHLDDLQSFAAILVGESRKDSDAPQ